MRVISRITALARGFFGRKVGELEERNPGALMEDLKEQIERTAREAEKQVIDIQTGAELIKAEMQNSESSLDTVRSRIEAAKEKGDIELLTGLLLQEEDRKKDYEDNKQMYQKAMEEVSQIREDYKVFEAEMNAKLNELKSLKSSSRIAALRENIISLNTKYSSRNKRLEKLNESFERLRQAVDVKTARARAYQTIIGEDPETRLRKLDMDSRKETAKRRAEAMLNRSEEETGA